MSVEEGERFSPGGGLTVISGSEGAVLVDEGAVAVEEWTVAVDEDGRRDEEEGAKTSSFETSGTAGSGPSLIT